MDDVYSSDLVPCSVCGRKFTKESLQRHENICEKVYTKQRRQFDSSKKRVEGTELATFKKPPGTQKKTEAVQKKKSSWKETHLEFINSIRAARGAQLAIKSGKPLPPPPPPSKNPDYVQCEYCLRRFNSSAAERHIPFCKTQQNKKGQANPIATQKQATRVNYQPPLPKGRQPGISGYDHDFGDGVRSTKSSLRLGTSNNRTLLPSFSSKAQPRNEIGMNNSASRGTQGTGYPSVNDRLSKTQDHTTSGPALRTGRTAQTYNDTKQLSAKQIATASANSASGSRKYPSSDSLSPSPQYAGSAFPSSQSHHWRGNGNHIGEDNKIRSQGGRGSSLYGRISKNGTFHKTQSTTKISGFPAPIAKRPPSGGKFCNECGAKFITATSKFCSECGAKKYF